MENDGLVAEIGRDSDSRSGENPTANKLSPYPSGPRELETAEMLSLRRMEIVGVGKFWGCTL